MNKNSEMIYLFSSDQKELYKQDSLNVMAYPDNFIYHFRYDDKWVSVDLKNNKMRQKEGIIVFVHADKSNNKSIKPKFYPLRKFVIDSIETDGIVWHFYFRLGKYVNYSKNSYQEDIETLRDLPTESSSELQGYFATLGRKIEFTFSSKQETWQELVRKLEQIPTLSNTIFYKVNNIKINDRLLDVAEIKKSYSGFVLNSGMDYLMELSFYRENYPTEEIKNSSLEVIVNRNYFQEPMPMNIATSFRTDRVKIYLVSKRLYESAATNIILKLKSEAQNVDAPSVQIWTKLSFNIFFVSIVLILFAFGIGITSLPNVWCKIVGPLAASTSLFLFNRQIR